MKRFKTIIISLVLLIVGVLVGFSFTMNNLQVIEINQKDNIILVEILNQKWVYEKN